MAAVRRRLEPCRVVVGRARRARAYGGGRSLFLPRRRGPPASPGQAGHPRRSAVVTTAATLPLSFLRLPIRGRALAPTRARRTGSAPAAARAARPSRGAGRRAARPSRRTTHTPPTARTAPGAAKGRDA